MSSPPPAAVTAPLLVVVIGNASRGDDALGPALAAQLRARGVIEIGAIELCEVYQLQLEDMLLLGGRHAVLFVDAARPGVVSGVSLHALAAAAAPCAFTHALAPAALLALYQRVWQATPPPAWLLAIEGESFELGAALSAAARQRLQRAEVLAIEWLVDGRAGTRSAARRAARSRYG